MLAAGLWSTCVSRKALPGLASWPASVTRDVDLAMRARALLPTILLLFAASAAPAAPQLRVQVEPVPVPSVPPPPSLPPSTPRPQAPFRMPDQCPFEYGCDFGTWQACEALVVRRAPHAGAAIRYRLAAMERLRALRADLILTRFGRVRVDYPMAPDPFPGWPPLPVGTDVVVFKAYTEAGYGIWAAGRAWDVESFWEREPSPRVPGRLLEAPRMTWWVEVETLDGQRGWLELRNTAEDGKGMDFAEAIRMSDGPATEDDPGCAEILRRREDG